MTVALYDHVVTQGHYLRSLRDFLTDEFGAPLNLAGHTVKFRMTNDAGSLIINDRDAVVVNAGTGEVRYDPSAPDFATAGDYWGWWIVTRVADGKTDAHPAGRRLKILVERGT